MAGRDASTQLGGMLSQIGNTLASRSAAGQGLMSPIRNTFRPQLDPNDPASLQQMAQFKARIGETDQARLFTAQARLQAEEQRRAEAARAAEQKLQRESELASVLRATTDRLMSGTLTKAEEQALTARGTALGNPNLVADARAAAAQELTDREALRAERARPRVRGFTAGLASVPLAELAENKDYINFSKAYPGAAKEYLATRRDEAEQDLNLARLTQEYGPIMDSDIENFRIQIDGLEGQFRDMAERLLANAQKSDNPGSVRQQLRGLIQAGRAGARTAARESLADKATTVTFAQGVLTDYLRGLRADTEFGDYLTADNSEEFRSMQRAVQVVEGLLEPESEFLERFFADLKIREDDIPAGVNRMAYTKFMLDRALRDELERKDARIPGLRERLFSLEEGIMDNPDSDVPVVGAPLGQVLRNEPLRAERAASTEPPERGVGTIFQTQD